MKNDKWSHFCWVYYRLKAMGGTEVFWRLNQAWLKKRERKQFAGAGVSVTQPIYAAPSMSYDFLAIGICPDNKNYSLGEQPYLLGGFSYQQYCRDWYAGFQTEQHWPQSFSYDISVSGREDIGDIRTNWDLNRNYDFALMAKNYYVTGNQEALEELRQLFYDWVRKNPFLHGPAWTSPMELGVRSVNWLFMGAFLTMAERRFQCDLQKWLQDIARGVYNMTCYIRKHRSRYSSANNHLLIEMCAVAIAGLVLRQPAWTVEALSILDKELFLQNEPDGVNKEMSLHYQTFGMEAYGILIPLLRRGGFHVPESWEPQLMKMAEFVADSMVTQECAAEFGDNDEGKLLDLQGGRMNHYIYVLQLMSMALPVRYGSWHSWHENLCWLYSETERERSCAKRLYESNSSKVYPHGGYTFLKDTQREVVLAMDHAALGFGSIAAHGHADALSIQLFVQGIPVFVDSGTFNYHVPANKRDVYRSTRAHNTVYVHDVEQSEMLGPFLWGRRAYTKLDKVDFSEPIQTVCATAQYSGIEHHRECQLSRYGKIVVADTVRMGEQRKAEQQFIVPAEWQVYEQVDELCLTRGCIRIRLRSNMQYATFPVKISRIYGVEEDGHLLCFGGSLDLHKGKMEIITEIVIEGVR